MLKNFQPKEKKEEKRGFYFGALFCFVLFSSPQERHSISSLFFHKAAVKNCTETSNLGGVLPMAISIVIDVNKRIKQHTWEEQVV